MAHSLKLKRGGGGRRNRGSSLRPSPRTAATRSRGSTSAARFPAELCGESSAERSTRTRKARRRPVAARRPRSLIQGLGPPDTFVVKRPRPWVLPPTASTPDRSRSRPPAPSSLPIFQTRRPTSRRGSAGTRGTSTRARRTRRGARSRRTWPRSRAAPDAYCYASGMAATNAVLSLRQGGPARRRLRQRVRRHPPPLHQGPRALRHRVRVPRRSATPRRFDAARPATSTCSGSRRPPTR